jgi:hypothetical protein
MAGIIKRIIAPTRKRLDNYLGQLNLLYDTQQKPILGSEESIKELEIRIRSTVEQLEKLHAKWTDVMAPMTGDEATAADADFAAYVETTNFIETLEKAREALDRIACSFKTIPTKPTIEDTIIVPQISQTNTVKLPKMNLPTFNGSRINWSSFWQCFEVTIHNRDFLSKLEKLTFLISCLKDDALQAVAGYGVTEENYDVVRKLLYEKYGETNMLISSLTAELVNLPPSQDNFNSVRSTADHIERLKSLLSLSFLNGSYQN